MSDKAAFLASLTVERLLELRVDYERDGLKSCVDLIDLLVAERTESARLRERVAVLEGERSLCTLEGADSHECCDCAPDLLANLQEKRARVAELETRLAEAGAVTRRQGRELGEQDTRVAELEEALRQCAVHCGSGGCEVETRDRPGTSRCSIADAALAPPSKGPTDG